MSKVSFIYVPKLNGRRRDGKNIAAKKCKQTSISPHFMGDRPLSLLPHQMLLTNFSRIFSGKKSDFFCDLLLYFYPICRDKCGVDFRRNLISRLFPSILQPPKPDLYGHELTEKNFFARKMARFSGNQVEENEVSICLITSLRFRLIHKLQTIIPRV